MNDRWNNATLYESYIGRWSRLVAPEFISWINQATHLTWLDAGCGTGALSQAILELKDPLKITGIDPSESHIQFAKEHFKLNSNVSLEVGDATHIPLPDHSVDVVVSGLVLNFIKDIQKAIAEFKRVSRDHGMVCAYVWDYSDKMEMMKYFWDAATALFEDAREKAESVRFPFCKEDKLDALFQSEGLSGIETTVIDVPTFFRDFNDFWNPFLSGNAPAPGYCMSLTEGARQTLKNRILHSLPMEPDGSIQLIARAVCIKAINIKDQVG